MKKTIIIIKKNSLILDGKEYNFDNIYEIKHLIKANIKIIILEEDLYVKKFENNVKRCNVSEFVNYKISTDFPQNGDILYDYEFKKKSNVILIYSIRSAKRIEKLCENAKELEVKPIQFVIKKVMARYLKNNSFTAKVLIKFNEVFYFVSFIEGLFSYGFIEEDKELVLGKIAKNSEHGDIYVDEHCAKALISEGKIKHVKMNMRELIDEEIY